ncbi:MAG: DUF1963 domain-containing protein, partial [Bifidobacteriaceae bacterium]|nr:DUF1963 domain-containing protein [Bifidobacteriaceae bacterium]
RVAGRCRALLADALVAWAGLRQWLNTGPALPPAADAAEAALADRWQRAFGPDRHRLGGQPSFPGDDPRLTPRYASFSALLLQLQTDPAAGLDWGEGGACHFFIEPGRLAQRDFSRVVYHWDCR